MSFISSIYQLLPVPIQNIGISGFGYYWKKRRFGGVFEQEYKAVKERESFSKQQWRDYQTIELRKLLLHAWDTVPFYRLKYQTNGITRSLLEKFELEQLSLLPILTKDELRQFGTTTLLSTKPEPGGKFYASSGSTGTPTQIMYSTQMHQRWSASFEGRIRNWAGVSRFDSRGMIGGRRVVPQANSNGPFYRYNKFEKQTYFSAYHISAETVANYLEGIIKHNVKYMIGYAASNYFLASFIEENKLQSPKLSAVITSSEKLTSNMRATLERVYQCEVFDAYSSVEACCSITESEHHQLLESPDVGINEYLNQNLSQQVLPEQQGSVVCTGLLNYNQPLIRYHIGDLIELAANQYTKCGRNFTVIKDIVGRTEDVIIGKDGRRMVRFHGISVGIPKLIQTQIIQHDLDSFEIKMILTESLSPKERSIIQDRMFSQLGPVHIAFTEVDHFQLNANGKFKAVVSNLSNIDS
ncbi:MAG: hypothetical protein MUE96_03695 [Bacteroidia bacterium]|jgi:phenylacetate-CoA ligase|nr:hypothetical protein [Bacteroidia bacterium]